MAIVKALHATVAELPNPQESLNVVNCMVVPAMAVVEKPELPVAPDALALIHDTVINVVARPEDGELV